MRFPKLLMAEGPLRVFFEASLLGGLCWLILIFFDRSLSFNNGPLVTPFLIGPLCIFWCALRLRKWQGSKLRASVVALLLIASVDGVLLLLEQLSALISPGTLHRHSENALFLADFIVHSMMFACFRVGMHLLRAWDQLRRKHLIWSFTHNQVMAILVVAGGLIALLITLIIVINRGTFKIDTLVGVTLGSVITGAILMVPVALVMALLAHLMVRHTLPRLGALAAATTALRAGNYATRIPVTGEDEVAQLQSDFNAMADDLQRTMQALQKERDTVSALLQSRRELIANVSHDLRTPVATLRSYLEYTLEHWNTISLLTHHHDLQIMVCEIVRLQALVEDLFTLSRAEVGQLTLQCVPTDVGSLVQRVVAARAPIDWQSSKVELLAEVPEHLPLALVDAQRLEQVLQNLLHNAVRHTPPGGIVAVALSATPTALVLQVKDTGEGIAAQDLPYIFERFYQAQNARARLGGGSGLGLALVKEWVVAMKGTIAVESIVGGGTCFTIHLLLAGVLNRYVAAPA